MLARCRGRDVLPHGVSVPARGGHPGPPRGARPAGRARHAAADGGSVTTPATGWPAAAVSLGGSIAVDPRARPAAPVAGMSPPRHLPVMLAEIVELLAPALAATSRSWSTARSDWRPRRGPAPGLPRGPVGRSGPRPRALALAAERLAPFGDRVTLVEAVYDELPEVLARLGRPRVQGILLDLGLSSLQIDDPERGFAYAYDAPLDMRMGRQELTAAEVVNTYAKADLARILRSYGEERFADRIAGRIVAERAREPFTTSGRLVRLLSDAVPMKSQRSGGHPAKRTFQALRIEVNGELAALESVLPDAVAALAVGGRIAVLAYHSLEDRLVKQLLAAGAGTAPAGPAGRAGRLAPELRLLTRGAQRPDRGRGRRQPPGRVGPAAGGRAHRGTECGMSAHRQDERAR